MKARLLAGAAGLVVISCAIDFARAGDVFMVSSPSGAALLVFIVVVLGIGITSLARLIWRGLRAP